MTDRRYVSRGGEKLEAALDAFGLNPAGLTCVDLGANVGGFTDCLLQHGAANVYAVDTGYGDLAWTLRNDDRVVVMERTNALHAEPAALVDLAVLDVAWTPLSRIVPAAARWVRPGGCIIALLKPHFELAKLDPRPGRRKRPRKLDPTLCDETARTVQQQLAEIGLPPRAGLRCPIVGKGGNREYLLWLDRPNHR